MCWDRIVEATSHPSIPQRQEPSAPRLGHPPAEPPWSPPANLSRVESREAGARVEGSTAEEPLSVPPAAEAEPITASA